jgi:hypothetical protein
MCRGTFDDHLRRHEEAWATLLAGYAEKRARLQMTMACT